MATPVDAAGWARIALYAWTARTGWRWDYVAATDYQWSAQPSGDWCFVP